MKILFTIAMALSISLSSFAGPTNQLSQLSSVNFINEKGKVTLYEGIGKVRVSVLNEKGTKLYSTWLNVKKNLELPLDLSQLPYGEYTVRIENKLNSVQHQVITSMKPAPAPPFKALIKAGEDNSLLLTVYDALEPGITVRWLDNQHKVLYREKITENGAFVRRYQFRNVDKSQVYVSLTDRRGNQQIYTIES